MSVVWLEIGAGLAIGGLAAFAILLFTWLIDSTIFRPLMGVESYRGVVIQYALWNLLTTLLSAFSLIPLAIGATLNTLANVRNWALPIVCLTFFAIGSGVWNNYHDGAIGAYIVFDQCYAREAIDFFLLPVLNCLRIAWNGLYPFVNFYVDMIAALEFVPPITLFKCATQVQLLNMMGYFINIFYAFSLDLAVYLRGDFLSGPFIILGSLNAAGLWVQAMIAPLNCFCKALGFLYNALAIFARLPSVHFFLNCLWNLLIRLIQLPFNTILINNPHIPDFQNVTEEACCALHAGGDAVRDTTFLFAQTVWGLFTLGSQTLPHPIAQFLSTSWPDIVANPLCGLAMATNVTLTAIAHYDALTAADGSGVAYLQVGPIVDELLGAASAVGQLFVLFNNDAQAAVTTALWTLVYLAGFVFEFGFGSVWYYLFGCGLPFYPAAPCERSIINYLAHYWTNYWLQPGFTVGSYTYSTYLSSAFLSAYETTQAFGYVIADITGSRPYGALFQYLFNIVIGLLEVLLNLIAFFYPIITFASDPLTSARAVDWNPVFNNMYAFAGAAGDSIRQYQQPDPVTNLTCQPSINETDKTLICCAGNLVERTLDIIPILLEQVIDFIVDIITLPTGLVTPCIPFIPAQNYTFSNITYTQACIRVPDLAVALFLLDEALCDFTCMIGSIIPFVGQYQCTFPLQPPPTDPNTPPVVPPNCGHIGTCTGELLCSILHIFVVPLWIVNSFLSMATNGIVFSDFTNFVRFVLIQIAIAVAAALAQFGLLLDCMLCAFTHFPQASPNCATTIYQVFLSLGYLIRALPELFTVLGLTIFKLVVTFFVAFVTGANPIKALIDFIVGILTDVMGGLGQAVVNFLVSLFNAVGLGFVGQFINVLWHGFCPLMQAVLNAIILILNIFAFGSIKFVEFCCFGGKCVPSGGFKKRADGQERMYGLLDGILHVNVSNWLMHMADQMRWPEDSPCNASIPVMSERGWTNLSEDEWGDTMYCVARPLWGWRNDSQGEMNPSKCDKLMSHYNFTRWLDVPYGDRQDIVECIEQRFYMDVVRIGSGAHWLPSDLTTNHARKWKFGVELAYGGFIYWQFRSDHNKPLDVLKSPGYALQWSRMGLNVSHYETLQTAQDVARFRHQIKLHDYFEWNGHAPQHDAVKALSVGVSAFGYHMLQSLYNTTKAFSDGYRGDSTDPTHYLSHAYHVGDEGAGARAAFSTLVMLGLEGLMNATEYWANPENSKKRIEAAEKVQLAAIGMYKASMEQLKMMAVEYIQDKRHEYTCNTGGCSLNETLAYQQAYEDSLRKDEHSIVFKASRWWEQNRETFGTVYPIAHPRYPVPTEEESARRAGYTYVDKDGVERRETGMQRLRRYYDSLWELSPQAQERWVSITRLGSSIKQQIYGNVVKRHMASVVDYTARVYGSAVKARAALEEEVVFTPPTIPPPPKPTQTVDPSQWAQPGQRVVVLKTDRLMSPEETARMALEQPVTQYESTEVRLARETHCQPGVAVAYNSLCRGYKPRYEPQWPTSTLSVRARNVYPSKTLFTAKDYKLGEVPGDLLLPKHSPLRRLLYSDLARASVITIDGFFDLTCYTNITFDNNTTLCDECFVLDQLVGRFLAAVDFTETWYTINFQASLLLATQLFDYLFNPSAYVLLGNQNGLSPNGFPNIAGFEYNLQYFDDNTNKTGFNFFNNTNVTVPANATATLALFGPLDYIYVNAWVLGVIGDVLAVIGGTLWQYIFYSDRSAPDTLLAIVNTCILCKWLTGEDFLGFSKRFSIGITALLFVTVYVVLGLLFGLVFGWSPFSLLGYTGLFAMLTFFAFLTVYTNWGWLCWYGLPMPLADDTLYWLVYTVLPKCVWFWGFLVVEDNYDNTHCYGCDNAEQWTILNCVHDRGFGDIIANIVFMLQLYSPETLQWIRDSRIPIISMIYRIPWVAERINAFSGVNLQDPRVYSQYMGCNYIVTLLPNGIIGSLFMAVVGVFLPFLVLVFTVLATAFAIVMQLLFLTYLMLADITLSVLTAPYVVSGLGPTQDDTPDTPSQLDADTGQPLALNARRGDTSPRKRKRVLYSRPVAPPDVVYAEHRNNITLAMVLGIPRRVWQYLFNRKQKQA